MLLLATILVLVIGGVIVVALARRERTPRTPTVDGPPPDLEHAPQTRPRREPET